MRFLYEFIGYHAQRLGWGYYFTDATPIKEQIALFVPATYQQLYEMRSDISVQVPRLHYRMKPFVIDNEVSPVSWRSLLRRFS